MPHTKIPHTHKAIGFSAIVADMVNFCPANRNVHKEIKSWAQELKALCTGLRDDTIRLSDDCDRNYKEAKKLQRVLVGHAKTSLRVIEPSFPSAPAMASSPVP